MLIGGHRGCGVTDRPGITRSDIPAENTLESLLGALRADFIETDAVATVEGEIVLIHSSDTSMHVLPPEQAIPGKRFVSQLTLAEVQSLRTGPGGAGRIASLHELLQALTAEFPGSSVILDLELKGGPALARPVLETIRQERFPLERILFTSFSLETIQELSAQSPAARIGLLFASARECEAPFSCRNIEAALQRLPHLTALAPEIRDLTSETVALAARRGFSLFTWGDCEESPLRSPAFAAAAKQAVRLCDRYRVPRALITDFVADLRRFLTALPPSSPPAPASPCS